MEKINEVWNLLPLKLNLDCSRRDFFSLIIRIDKASCFNDRKLILVDENLIISSIEISSGILRMTPSRETRKLGMRASRLKLNRASLEVTLEVFPS